MSVKQQISSFPIIVTMSTIGMLVIGSNFFVYADEARLSNFHSMKKLVQAIEAGKVDNDKMVGKISEPRKFIKMQVIILKNV